MVSEAFDLEFAMNASTYLQYYLFVNDNYPKWRLFLQTIHEIMGHKNNSRHYACLCHHEQHDN